MNQVADTLRLTGSFETVCADTDFVGQVIAAQHATGGQEGVDQTVKHDFYCSRAFKNNRVETGVETNVNVSAHQQWQQSEGSQSRGE